MKIKSIKIMALVKLSKEEKLLLSRKVDELNILHRQAIIMDATSYQYDWRSLDAAIWQAVLEYRHILNTNECISP
jgi:hypothetical protein